MKETAQQRDSTNQFTGTVFTVLGEKVSVVEMRKDLHLMLCSTEVGADFGNTQVGQLTMNLL